jgi:hypothetical protein
MKKSEINNEQWDYVKSEGLDKLINFVEENKDNDNVFGSTSGKVKTPIAPDVDDLARLHKVIRKRKSFTVLEFGVGFSSLIIADALKKNEEDWNNLKSKPEIRNRFMFQLFSVDASEEWIEKTKKRFNEDLLGRVHFSHSPVEIGKHNGQICHFYKKIPDIIPDFIYLDGPAARDVKGEINGLSFKCIERTPVAADLLLMESTLLPGAFILVDGRTNNARFLERNFTRSFKKEWDHINDVTTFELVEERLGKYNIQATDFFK